VDSRRPLHVRVGLPDRPGALGALATAIAATAANIEQITVLERRRREAIDDLLLDWPTVRPTELLAEILAPIGARLLGMREPRPSAGSDVELPLFDRLVSGGAALDNLVEAALESFDADWCALVDLAGELAGQPSIVAAAGPLPSGAPWLRLHRAQAHTVLLRDAELVVAVRLDGDVVFCVGREPGLPWHWIEARRVRAVAVAASRIDVRGAQSRPRANAASRSC
jgi:ACT domain